MPATRPEGELPEPTIPMIPAKPHSADFLANPFASQPPKPPRQTQTASVGRVVHYVSYGTPGGEYGRECRAAIITEVSPERKSETEEIVSLAVLNPTGMFFNQGCVHSELENHGGTWHWPERTA